MVRSDLRSVADDEGADLDALVGQVASGDVAAFERLYDDATAAVFGLARRLVRDQVHAEDITQEVFVEVWRKAGRFDPHKGRARTWILTVAHRRAVDAVRQSEARRRGDGRAATRRSVPEDGPADLAVAGEERSRVHECLRALTDLQRESVQLAYFDGYTYQEVAAMLERPLSTVKTRMRNGLIRLRECLGRVR